MYTKTQSGKQAFIIYQTKNSIVMSSILAGIACVGFGAFFSYQFILKEEYPPVAFGCVFVLFGLLLLLQLPKNCRKMAEDNGFIYLKANHQGLSLAPLVGLNPIDYDWAKVSQILLTEKIISKEIDGETSYRSNMLIIYFYNCNNRNNSGEIQSLIQFAKDQIEKSPKKFDICSIPFPKGEAEKIKRELACFFSNNQISIYKKVFFDYKKAIELFET